MRSAVIVASFCSLCAIAHSQEFAVSIREEPDKSGDVESIGRTLAAPLVKNGADAKLVNERAKPIRDAAMRLSRGYSYKGAIRFWTEGEVFRLDFPVPNVSSGDAYEASTFFFDNTTIEFSPPDAMIHERDRRSYYWTPFDQFVFLGKAPVNVNATGEFKAAEGMGTVWLVSWKPTANNSISVVGSIVSPDGTVVHKAEAIVSIDRSRGVIKRFHRDKDLFRTVTFVRTNKSVPACNSVDLPVGIPIADFRLGGGYPAQYVWQGSMKPLKELKGIIDKPAPLDAGTAAVRYGLPLIGATFVIYGLRLQKKKKQPMAGNP